MLEYLRAGVCVCSSMCVLEYVRALEYVLKLDRVHCWMMDILNLNSCFFDSKDKEVGLL